MNRGNSYDDKGQHDLAIDDYNETIQFNPDNAEAYGDRGLAYFYKGQYDPAIADYTKSLQLDPNDAIIYSDRGLAYDDKGQYGLAIADYNKALQMNPNNVGNYNNRGWVYMEKGEFGKAIADYGKALELDPKNSNAYANLGEAYEALGQYGKAISYYKKAIGLNDTNEYSRIWIVNSSKHISRSLAARYMKDLPAYVASHPSDKWARTVSQYYLGYVTEKGLLKEADGNKVHICQAYYYVGEETLWRGNRAASKRAFAKSLSTGETGQDEYIFSKIMLGKLSSGRVKPVK